MNHTCPLTTRPLPPSSHTPSSRPQRIAYIDDGYNMTLTDAPKLLGGRLDLNFARTTPELP
jgi:hypothetical protein